MFSPLTFFALFYISGIFLSNSLDVGFVLILCAGLFLSALLLFPIKRRINIFVILIAFSMTLGCVRYLDTIQSEFAKEFTDKYITVSGYINSSAQETESKNKYRYTLRVQNAFYLDNHYKLNQDILLNADKKFDFGDTVQVTGHLLPLEERQNQNEYDFSLYYKSKGIYARLIADDAVKTGRKISISPVYLINSAKARLGKICDREFSKMPAAFVKAITLGDKSGFDSDYRALLSKSGFSHVLYAPFIHISLIFMLVGILHIPKKSNRDNLVLFLILLYALFNSGAPNILKACGVLGIVLLRRNIFGFYDKLDSLSLIVLIMTIIDPNLCFNSGFCMSIISTVLIYTSHPIIFRAVSGWFSKRRIKASNLIQVVTIFIIFTIGTLPFSAYYFNGLSIYSTILSVAFLPLVILVIIFSYIMYFSILLFGASPIAKEVVLKIVEIFEVIPHIAREFPFSYVTLKSPDILEIICFYLAWWLFLLYISKRSKSTTAKVLTVILLGAVLSGIFPYSSNTLYINFVNVGQGDAAILRTTRGDTVLIDGGGSSDYQQGYNIGEAVFMPYLISCGIKDVDVAIISHFHKDHAEGIIAALENIKVNTLVMPDCDVDNIYRRKLLDIASAKGIKVESLMASDEIKFRSGLNIKCVSPTQKELKSSDANETSLVLSVTYGEFCGLFGGDSHDILTDLYPADVDLLKVSHHGSLTSSGEKFINHVSPQYAVISVGKGNSYGHPKAEVLLRLMNENSEILRTDRMGDIRFEIRKNGKIDYTALMPTY